MFNIFFCQYSIVLISFFLFYVLGKIIIGFFDTESLNSYFRLFLSSLIGAVSTILIYSILKTNFRTINILLIPIYLYFIYYFKSYMKFEKIKLRQVLFDIKILFLVGSFSYFYQLLFVLDWSTFEFKGLSGDYHMYASFIENLKSSGFENYKFEVNHYFPELAKGNMPYHYPELWLTSFISNFFHVSTVNTYILVINPFLTTLYFLGIFSIIFDKLIKINFYFKIALAFSLMYITSVFIPFSLGSLFNFYPYNPDGSIMGMESQKLIFVYIFLLLGFYFLLNKKEILGYFTLLILPIFNVSFLPGIYGGLILYQILNFIFNKFKMTRSNLFILLSTFFFLISYYCFYNIFENKLSKILMDGVNKFSVLQKFPKDLNSGYNYQNFKLFISNLFYYSIPSIFKLLIGSLKQIWVGFLFFTPYLVLLFTNVKSNIKQLLLIFSFIISASIFVVVVDGVSDRHQFLTNLSALFCVFIVLNYISFIEKSDFNLIKNKLILITLIIFQIFFCAKHSVNNLIFEPINENKIDFLKKIKSEITEDELSILVFLGKDDFDPNLFEFWYSHNDLLGLNQITNKTIIFSIGNPEDYLISNELAEASKINYQYATPINYWRSLKKGNNLEKFIKKYRIKYCFFQSIIKVPSFIKKNTKKLILTNDRKSEFYILK